MNRQLQNVFLTALAALSFSSFAAAETLQWTASGIEYVSNLGTVTGSFDYNADLNSFTNIDLTSSPDGSVFQYLDPNFTPSGGDFIFTDSDSSNLTDAQYLYVVVNPEMTDAGGTTPIANLEEGTCTNSTCTDGPPITYEALSGEFTASEVSPEPASAVLDGVGAIAILGLALRRPRAKLQSR